MYDFEHYIDRTGTGSEKWADMARRKANVPPGVIPFSVADMELASPPEITEGLAEFVKKSILGYEGATPSYYEAVAGWMETRHSWRVENDWLVETNGVVPAMFSAVNAFTKQGEGVIIMTPVYYPFFLAARNGGRRLVEVPLAAADSRYEIDFDRMAEAAAKKENTLLLLCSPHNPTGRVWTRDELETLAEICLKHGVFVASDEIHFDLTMPGQRHTVYATLSPEAANNSFVATSPSKTFNLAGTQASNVFIPDPDRRAAFIADRRASGLVANNIFAYQACELAYKHGTAWLDELLVHLHGNFTFLRDFMAAHFPEVRVTPLEGTYLAWLDFRAWGMDAKALERFMVDEADLFFSEGWVFGKEGEGFERMNLACPRAKIRETLERLFAARKAASA